MNEQTIKLLARLSGKSTVVVEKSVSMARKVNAVGGNGLQVLKAVADMLGVKYTSFKDQVGDRLRVGSRSCTIVKVTKSEVLCSDDSAYIIIPVSYPLLCNLK